jgi:hypothetical protein
MLQEAVVLQGSKQGGDTIARWEYATITYHICCWSQGQQQQALMIARMTAMFLPFYVVSKGAATTIDG